MRFSFVLWVLAAALATACIGSEPSTQPVKVSSPVQQPSAEKARPEAAQQEKTFTISKEQESKTKIDIQQFILNLNEIVRTGNYDAWVTNLSKEYFLTISSPENLERWSNWRILHDAHIVLKTPQDYFKYVVMPSHSNDHVVGIKFLTPTRVKALAYNDRGELVSLYVLENINTYWKIVN
jgi:hypothetical protein